MCPSPPVTLPPHTPIIERLLESMTGGCDSFRFPTCAGLWRLTASFWPVRFFDFGQEATGVIAIGQIATGVLAIGQFATGVFAIGQVSRGVIAIGQVSVGIAAAGQLGFGMFYGTGMLGFGTFAGGLIPVPLLGHLRLGDLIHLRFRLDLVRLTPWRIVLITGIDVLVAVAALIPLWRELFGVEGIFYFPPPRR